MRDINRIYPIMNELTTIWTTYCPDWRFGQLIENFKTCEQIDDLFYMEDSEILEKLRHFKKEKLK